MYTFFLVILYASIINLVISYFLIPIYSKISMLKPQFIYPLVLVLAILGTYASRNSITDVWLLLVAGLLGVILKKGKYPLGPLVLAYIIGPGAERALRQALLLGRGDWVVLFKSPIALGFYAITFVTMILLIRFKKTTIKETETTITD